jgi:hypothetical protein
MASAKYLVTMPPGAEVIGLGFIREGRVFSAPSEDYVPSRTFLPVNKEALAPLAKVYDGIKKHVEKRLESAKKADARDGGARADQVYAELDKLEAARVRASQLIEIPKEEPKVEPGLTLSELDGVQARAAALADAKKESPAASPRDGGKGDRKL